MSATEQKPNADDSQQFKAPTIAPAAPTVDSLVLKVIAAVVLLVFSFGAGGSASAFLLVDRTNAAIEKQIDAHEEHPHEGAATEKDLKPVEKQINRVIWLLGGVPVPPAPASRSEHP